MQNKGAIKLFAILLALVCAFQLSFTLITSRVESKARAYANSEEVYKQAKELANGDKLKENFYIDSISKARERYFIDSLSNQVVYNLLIRKYTYLECKTREINLGLDLKGGMNVMLEVSMADIIKAMADNTDDPAFNKIVDLAVKKQKDSQKDFVTLFEQSVKEVDPNIKLAAFFSFELKEKLNANSTNEEVIKVIKNETKDAFDRTFEILRKRIDKFGVTQPNIQKLEQSERILVELPGIKDPERVRKLLQGTAQLEFWETYELSNQEDATKLINGLEKADEFLVSLRNMAPEKERDTALISGDSTVAATVDTTSTQIAENKTADSANDLINKLKTGDTTKGKKKEDQSREEFMKKHPLLSLIQLNIDQKTGQTGRGPVVGYASVKDMSTISILLEKAQKALPRNLKLLWTAKPIDDKSGVYQLIALKVSTRDGRAPLSGGVIVDARQDFDQNGKNEISMTMNAEGASIWKKLTGANVDRSIAIVLDNYVYSFPTVNQEIGGGRSSITGNFTLEEAKDLANILKAGKLPAPARIVQEAVVGPSLGKEAINSGLFSFIIAFLLVLLYMFIFYNGAGLVANVALITNLFFLFGVLASLQAVLTLPGIAGIVLTMGMAVDANVIIYERIKEEIRAGKGLRLALTDGYKHAYSAIIDGNVTTLITGIILYIFGTGPIQGFATTLCIGILTSLFSAIFISRIIFTWMVDKNKKVSFYHGFSQNFLSNIKFPFIGSRKFAYIFSITTFVIALAAFAFKGINYGIDFKGGRTFVVRFDQDVRTDGIRESLAKQYGEAPEVKSFGPNNQVKVTTKFMIENTSQEADSIVTAKLYEGCKTFYKEPIAKELFTSDKEDKVIGKLSSEMVGPTIADDIKRSAFMAILFSLLCIFAYIAVRFKRWEYGVGGVVSLFHDSIITIGVFSLFNGILPFTMEVDQAFIAAILTIIGYSINDTVIIFDRIREYKTLFPKRDIKDVMDDAMNSTLPRTMNTAGTTLVVLLAIFIFGGEVIRGFTFALLFGIAIGTYSSVFVASPIAYDLIQWKKKRDEKKKSLNTTK